ncbi:hypothetical protein BKA62DRAFT_75863 [Auriculariales sp. MPI-PUGE-AT-0066]|nr:hypothetical protein BKA62DRAFT_75863 [Auriculariales sp. MPI-PUGE-AT-0066]
MTTEYDKRYPPDRPGEEADEDARVWRVYRDRASDADEEMIGGWNKTLDVLLIFAGLFSAVATSFLVEAQKQLQPDQATYLTSVFLAVHRNESLTDSRFDPDAYVAPVFATAVTALWLVSLVIALIVALLAILAKQWLGEYSSRMRAPAASHCQWATRHVTLHNGLHRWKLDAYIGAMSVGLHVSLFLFLGGLVIFFRALSPWMALCTLTMAVSVLGFYLAAMIAPAVWEDCPARHRSCDRHADSFVSLLGRNFIEMTTTTKQHRFLKIKHTNRNRPWLGWSQPSQRSMTCMLPSGPWDV